MKISQIWLRVAFVLTLAITGPLSRAQNSAANVTPASAAVTPSQTPDTTTLSNGQYTTLGHLLASQSALKKTLPLLKKALKDNGGGFVEKATADVNLALADVDKAIAYVNAHPEVNTLQAGPAPEAEFGKIVPTDLPRYAQSSGHTRYPFLPNMSAAVDSLNDAVRAFMNIPSRAYNGPIMGSIGNYRSKIAADIMKASSDVLAALDYAHSQTMNPASTPRTEQIGCLWFINA